VDPAAEETVGESVSRSSNTPFTGWRLKGVIHKTVCGGKIVYERQEEA
jgi:dihydroorotase